MSAIDLGAGRDTHSEHSSAIRGALVQLARQPRVWAGGVILLTTMLLAVFAPHIAPHDPLGLQIEHFARVIRGEAEPLVSVRDGLQNLRITEAIAQAAATGSIVDTTPVH